MKLGMEALEPRLMMSADVGRMDVTGNGVVTPQDVLAIVNNLNADAVYVAAQDVNEDGFVTPVDALVVINYINEHPSPTQFYKVDLEPRIDTVGFTEQQIRDAIFAANDWFIEANVNLGLYEVNHGEHVYVKTVEIYLGGGWHARGMQDGSTLLLHNGKIGAGHGGTNYPYDSQVFGNQAAITKVFVHELGHWMGLGHSSDKNCIMHINAGAKKFCPAEVRWLQSHFGRLS